MKNNFAEEYAQATAIQKQYDKADAQGNEKGKSDARDDFRLFNENISRKGEAYSRIYRLYAEAKALGNKYIDIHNVVWDKDVKSLINDLRKYGIEKFTFSSTWSSAVETAWLFTKNGCTLESLIEINSQFTNLDRERQKVHGYLFKVNK